MSSREPIFEELADRLSGLMHHRHYHQHQSTASATLAMPVITATEAHMNLAQIGTDIRDHIAQGETFLAKVVEEHVPAILAEAERLQASPIVQSLEGLVLPPAVEQQIANMIAEMGKILPVAAAPVPAEGGADMQPVAVGPTVAGQA